MYDRQARTRNILNISKSDLALWVPESKNDLDLVQQQLERLVVHPLFHFSRRYPALLRYTVEQTLLGNTDQLKERSIGVEVFGRKPDYDTNADPVVRFTASEIRKRLAQYYVDPAHFNEIQIDLPSGTYIAVFSRCAREPANSEHSDTPAFEAAPVDRNQEVNGSPATRPMPAPVAVPHRTSRVVILVVLCATLSVAGGFCIGFWLHTLPDFSRWTDSHASPTDRFW